MISFVAVGLTILIVFLAYAVQIDDKSVTLQWFGQSCYLITSSKGTQILLDPIPEGMGYDLPGVSPDAVTVSHEHFDHTNVQLARGNPRVLRGLKGPDNTRADWVGIETQVKDVKIYNVPVYHDDNEGKDRGKNSIFIFQVDDLKVVHLGDLGHLLRDQDLKAIGTPDVVMIPVGGVYTIDAKGAHQVIDQLKPRMVILPMHYKTDVLKIGLETIDSFIKGRDNVKRADSNTLNISKDEMPEKLQIVVLRYK